MIAVVSKTRTSKLQTSDLENSDLETSVPRSFRPLEKTIEIVNAVLHECIYFFTMIIIVTNPKCQITQQSRIDHCGQLKGFLYFYSKQKRERQEQWQNYFTFSRVISAKRPELPGQCNDRCHTNLQATEIHARSKRGKGIMQMNGLIFRLACGILLHLCDNVASSYINILWISLTSFDPPYM